MLNEQHTDLLCTVVVFFKVNSPIEPVSFVHTICKDAAASTHRKQSRSVKRLTPITLCGKATERGLEEVAKQVLAPHFHHPGVTGKKV
jgi:tRNA acetyltransferase TAN1